MMSEKYILSKRCRERYFHESLYPSELLAYGGVSTLADYYEICRPRPDTARILWCYGGEGELHSEAGVEKIVRGEMVLLPKGTPHRYLLRGKRWLIFWVVLRAEHSPEGERVGVMTLGEEMRWVRELFVRACQPLEPSCAGAFRAMLDAWVLHQYRRFRHPRPDEHELAMSRLLQEVRKHPGKPWTLPRLAEYGKIYCSAVHFNRLCLKYWGATAMKTVRHLRMEEAKRQLRFSRYSLKSIAVSLGYANAYAFSSAFKRETGISPADFREQERPMTPLERG